MKLLSDCYSNFLSSVSGPPTGWIVAAVVLGILLLLVSVVGNVFFAKGIIKVDQRKCKFIIYFTTMFMIKRLKNKVFMCLVVRVSVIFVLVSCRTNSVFPDKTTCFIFGCFWEKFFLTSSAGLTQAKFYFFSSFYHTSFCSGIDFVHKFVL